MSKRTPFALRALQSFRSVAVGSVAVGSVAIIVAGLWCLVEGPGVATAADLVPAGASGKFRRGDANGDGSVNLADPLATIQNMLGETAGVLCRDAADSDDSGEIDFADAIYTASYLFMGGRVPPSPGPSECGGDPTPDGLTCEWSGDCSSAVVLAGKQSFPKAPDRQLDVAVERRGDEYPEGNMQVLRPPLNPIDPLPLKDSECVIVIEDIGLDMSDFDTANDANGASMGRCNGLASVAGDNQTFYVASEWGGLFKSADGGLTWDRLEGHLPTVMWDVEVDPVTTGIVYATSFYDGRVNSVAGIQVSYDAGINWTHPATAQPNALTEEGTAADNTPQAGYTCNNTRRTEPSAFGISIRSDAPQNVYIGTNCGLAISNDSGMTWQFVDPRPVPGGTGTADNVWDVVAQPATAANPQGIIDVVGDMGHSRSTDGGMTWSANNLAVRTRSIAVSPDESYVLLAAGLDNNLYESDDGGANWTNLGATDPIQGGGRIPFVQINDTTAGFDLWTGGVTLYRVACATPANPAPGGTPRCPAGANPLPANWFGGFSKGGLGGGTGAHDDVGDIVFDTQTAIDSPPLMCTNDGGVYYAQTTSAAPTDTSNLVWEQPDRGPHALWLFGMAGQDQAGMNSEDIYFGCQDTGVFATTSAGAEDPVSTWHVRSCCDGFDLAADDDTVLYTRGFFQPGRGFEIFLDGPGLPGFGESKINTYPAGGLVTAFNFAESMDTWGDDKYAVLMNDCINPANDGLDNDNNGTVDDEPSNGCPTGGGRGTDGGLFITSDITANPIQWTELGPNEPFPSGRLADLQVALDGDGNPTFYATVGGGNAASADQLWKFVGTDPTGSWTRIDTNILIDDDSDGLFNEDDFDFVDNDGDGYFDEDDRNLDGNDNDGDGLVDEDPPDAIDNDGDFQTDEDISGVNVFGVDPNDPNRLYASAMTTGAPQMVFSNDGGMTWQRDAELDNMMQGGGVFQYRNQAGPTNFTGLGGYPQPSLVAFDPEDPDILVAGGHDSGIFISTTRGQSWNLLTDPFNSNVSGVPHIPRPLFVHFDHESPGPGQLRLYIGTQGFGVWRITVPLDPPVLTVPGPVVFNGVCVDETGIGVLEVCNTGGNCNDLGTNLVVSSITSSDPQFSVVEPSSGFPISISPDFCFPFQVRFDPTSEGPQSATLTIESNDPFNPSVDVQVSGVGALPRIATVVADSGDFGDVCVGSIKDLDLTINNSGGCDLQVNDLNSSSPEFQIASAMSFPLRIHPGDSLHLPVRLKPTSFGAKAADITVETNDPNTPSKEVSFTGNAPPGEIRVTGSTDFGDVCAGELAEKTISICNVGFCNLQVVSVAFDPPCEDFTLINNPFPATVSPDFCMDVVIRFTPTSVGQKSCTLVIMSDDPSNPVVMLEVTGNTPIPSIDVPPDLAFPPTVIRRLGPCRSELPFPISNTGECNLTITDIAITTNAEEYSLKGLPSFPVILEAGHIAGSGDLAVVFDPIDPARERLGEISVTYLSDPIIGETTTVTRTLCGEAVKTGARVLVRAGGVPVDEVEKIQLLRINANRNREAAGFDSLDVLLDAELQAVTPSAPCEPFSFQREYGAETNPVQLLPGFYQVSVTVRLGGRRETKIVGFNLDVCDFNDDIVVDF
jgi:photosystem II stability/assembly factor-like uncharacterized protein